MGREVGVRAPKGLPDVATEDPGAKWGHWLLVTRILTEAYARAHAIVEVRNASTDVRRAVYETRPSG